MKQHAESKLILTLSTTEPYAAELARWSVCTGMQVHAFLTKLVWEKMHNTQYQLPIEHGVRVQDYRAYRCLVNNVINEIIDAYNGFYQPVIQYPIHDALWIDVFPIKWIWFINLRTVVVYSDS